MESVDSSVVESSNSSSEDYIRSDDSIQKQSEEEDDDLSLPDYCGKASFWHSSTNNDDDEVEIEAVEIEIENLELLLEHQHLLSDVALSETDHAKCGSSISGMVSLEVDSLVLTRKRLPHLIHKRTAVLISADNDVTDDTNNMKMVVEFDDSDDIICDFDMPLEEPISSVLKRTPEKRSHEDEEDSTDSTTSSSSSSLSDDGDDRIEWDSLTVDSLVLARRRLSLSSSMKRRHPPLKLDSLIMARRARAAEERTEQKEEEITKEFICPLNDTTNVDDHPQHHRQHESHRHKHRSKRRTHVHYTAKLDEIIGGTTKPNNGGFNCAA